MPGFAAAAVSRLTALLADTLPGEAREVLKPSESLRHTTVVRTRNAERFAVRPLNVDEAIAAAVAEAR